MSCDSNCWKRCVKGAAMHLQSQFEATPFAIAPAASLCDLIHVGHSVSYGIAGLVHVFCVIFTLALCNALRFGNAVGLPSDKALCVGWELQIHDQITVTDRMCPSFRVKALARASTNIANVTWAASEAFVSTRRN